MTLNQKLFGFHGRIRRKDWWLLGLGVAVVYLVIATVLSGVFAHSTSYVGGVVQFVFLVLFNWIGFALSAKRMHDRGRSGWWLAIPLVIDLALIVVLSATFLGTTPGTDQNAMVSTLLGAGVIGGGLLIALAVAGIWLFVDLGILDGDPGPNSYGPSPKAAA